jgi:hypothetical protein
MFGCSSVGICNPPTLEHIQHLLIVVLEHWLLPQTSHDFLACRLPHVEILRVGNASTAHLATDACESIILSDAGITNSCELVTNSGPNFTRGKG